jgi:predicted ferric reductase
MNIKRLSFYLLFIANLGVTLFFWWQGSGPLVQSATAASLFIALGRLLGLVSMLLILVQLILVGRIRIVEREYGFDNLNRLHRRLGKVIISILIFHPIFLTIGYALNSHVSLLSQFILFLTTWDDVLKAAIGMVLLLSVVLISLQIVRRKLRYDTWYLTHLLVYVSIFFFFDHQTKTADVSSGWAFRYWYFINFFVFGLVLLYRFLRPLYLFSKHKFYLEKLVPETHDVTSLYISGKNMEKFRFESGQFAHLTFLTSNIKDWVTHHPFSFSQAPDGKHVRFSIKNSGDFTAKIGNMKPGTKIIIDGPFGVFTERRAKRDKYLFIAGGIGITPLYSLIQSLSKKHKDLVLLYSNKHEKDIVFKKELESMPVKVIHILSRENFQTGHFISGHIDGDLIKNSVPDYKDREIYICGPNAMMLTLINNLESVGTAQNQIHYERFAY